jgi:lysophospholipase L1-like esterase
VITYNGYPFRLLRGSKVFRRCLVAIAVVLAMVTAATASANAGAPTPTVAQVQADPGQIAPGLHTALPPVRILLMGDSITAGGQWAAELCRLMLQDAGRTCDIRNAAVGGVDCAYFVPRVWDLLAQHTPDVVALACGTNEDINAFIYGEPRTSWSWRAVTEAVRAWNPAVPMVTPFPMFADPLLAPAWLVNSLPITIDRIYVEMMRCFTCYVNVDWTVIPATAPYQDTSGFHPTPKGYKYQGRRVYDALAIKMGWPATNEPPLCDLYGHRPGGYAPWSLRPPYTPC